jgi:urocanate hydratase
VGLSATPPRSPEFPPRRPPDIVTDQTSAHDRSTATARPAGPAEWRAAGDRPQASSAPSGLMRAQSRPWWLFHAGRARPRLRQQHPPVAGRGPRGRLRFPGFVPPTSARSSAADRPFRWVPFGDPADIHATDAAMKRPLPREPHLHRWLDMAASASPSRAPGTHLLDRPRATATGGLCFNDMVARAELKAPSSSAATTSTRLRGSPNRETEGCATARTPCRTGRSSTRSSTRRRARPGCRSTTAAASAWDTRSTRAW